MRHRRLFIAGIAAGGIAKLHPPEHDHTFDVFAGVRRIALYDGPNGGERRLIGDPQHAGNVGEVLDSTCLKLHQNKVGQADNW